MSISIFNNPNIAKMNENEVKKHVADVQTKTWSDVDTYRRRKRDDFAIFMLEKRTQILTLKESVSATVIASLFTQHQITAATGDTSEYTPFIKLLFGRFDPEGKKVKFAGTEYVKWEADDSFGRYFNFYEVLDRDAKGLEGADLLKWVLDKGGPSAIVKAELARKAEERKPTTDTTTARNDLYLAETDMPPVDLPFTVPEKAGEFMSVIVQKVEGGYRMVGISKTDAKADFDKLAADNFDRLTKAKEEREAEESRQRKANEKVVSDLKSDPSKVVGQMTDAQRKALVKALAEKTTAAVKGRSVRGPKAPANG